MLDLSFATQVMAKLQIRFIRSCVLLGSALLVMAALAGFLQFKFQKEFKLVEGHMALASLDATYQEIEEVRATVQNFAQAFERSEDKKKFAQWAPLIDALERETALLRRAGEQAVLDGQKVQEVGKNMAPFMANARRVVAILIIISGIGLGLIFERTWRRFRWSLSYYQALQERQVMAEQVLASAMAPAAAGVSLEGEQLKAVADLYSSKALVNISQEEAALPPLPEVSAAAEDDLDLAKVLMKGVRHLRHQKQAFADRHVAHLDLPHTGAALGPAYLRKAVRFKTPLAVLITDPADLPQAQQVMNYSETGILIRIPHQATVWPRPGQLIQGRVGTANKFSVFSGTVVRIEQRPQGDLIGVRFVTAPW